MISKGGRFKPVLPEEIRSRQGLIPKNPDKLVLKPVMSLRKAFRLWTLIILC
jgi:hypothetical protein